MWILLFINVAFAIDIAVIDDFSSKKSHGTKVIQVLNDQGVSPGQIQTLSVNNYYESLKNVIKSKPSVLNLSFGSSRYDQQELELLKKISDNGTIILVAAGNDSQRINMKNPIFPCYYTTVENLICIGASESSLKSPKSNFGHKVNFFISGDSPFGNYSSFSSPKVGKIILSALKCNLNPLEYLKSAPTKIIDHQSQWFLDGLDPREYCYHPRTSDPL